MNEKQQVRISKFLSLVLRHKPGTIGLELDENGWTDTNELLEKMSQNGKSIDFEQLNIVVENNPKKRFAFNEDKTRIRANQGHSIKIDLGFEPQQPPEILYHGTGTKYLESILEQGLKKQKRHHVHLSADKETATKVGQRHGKLAMLEVATITMYQDGYKFYLSENGVWLTDEVPIEYLRQL